MLGWEGARGRAFGADEGWVNGKDPLIVLSYSYWQRRFGSDFSVIGKTVEVNRHAFTVIGVAPERYHGAYYFIAPDFYIPLTTLPLLDSALSNDLTYRSALMFLALRRL